MYSVTLTFILKVKHFLVVHLLEKNCTAHSADISGIFASTHAVPAVKLQLFK